MMNDTSDTTGSLEPLRRFHAEVDRDAGCLTRRHAPRMRCAKGCCDCCADELTVFAIEAERIRRSHRRLLQDERPHPPGRCAFLDAGGACRVYDDRPYVCRTQGLPLRWVEPGDANETFEYRDICPLNEDGGQPVEQLAAGECWTLGPAEQRLASLQLAWGGDHRRVHLRDLFRSTPDPEGDPPARA